MTEHHIAPNIPHHKGWTDLVIKGVSQGTINCQYAALLIKEWMKLLPLTCVQTRGESANHQHLDRTHEFTEHEEETGNDAQQVIHKQGSSPVIEILLLGTSGRGVVFYNANYVVN